MTETSACNLKHFRVAIQTVERSPLIKLTEQKLRMSPRTDGCINIRAPRFDIHVLKHLLRHDREMNRTHVPLYPEIAEFLLNRLR